VYGCPDESCIHIVDQPHEACLEGGGLGRRQRLYVFEYGPSALVHQFRRLVALLGDSFHDGISALRQEAYDFDVDGVDPGADSEQPWTWSKPPAFA